MERARILFLFGDPDIDPSDPELESDLVGDEDHWEPGKFEDEDGLGRLRSSIGRLVVAQVVSDDPPEVWATARRLLGGGLTRHQVFTQLQFALLSAVEAAVDDRRDDERFDPACYGEFLAALPLPDAGDVADAVVEAVEVDPGGPEETIVRRTLQHLGWAAGTGGQGHPGRAAMAASLVEEVIRDLVDAGDLEYLPPDRLVHVPSLTADIVLSHRLTDAEAAVDVLMAGVDLAGFARRDDLHLPGGADIDDLLLTDGQREWRGPHGWLDGYRPGTLLAVRVGDDGTVLLTDAGCDPDPDPALVARLRAAYDTEVADNGLPVTAEALVLGLLADDPDSFVEPGPPLATLCAAAGLEPRGGRVAHDESVWEAGYANDLQWRVLDRLEGDAARAALRILHGVAEADAEAATVRETLADLALPGVAEVVLEELTPAPGLDDDADPEFSAAVRDAAAAWVDGSLPPPPRPPSGRWPAGWRRSSPNGEERC